MWDRMAEIQIPAPKITGEPCPTHGNYTVEFGAIFWSPDGGEWLGALEVALSTN
jgi:hypothetical protein